MKVYLVKLDWSTEDSNDVEITVCGTYEKAYAKFKELIADEMNPDNSWVGELEWKNGVPKDDKIEFDFLDRRNDTDETECYWLITDTWGLRHPYLYLYRNQGGVGMKPHKTQAHIHSLNGEMDEITIIDKVGDNDYIVDYKGVKCHALFNWFNYDVYAIVKEV